MVVWKNSIDNEFGFVDLCMYSISESIQDSRAERLANEEISHDPTKVEKLRLKENVLERNLSPSLQGK